jgi:arylsulfatase A-like enzyme
VVFSRGRMAFLCALGVMTAIGCSRAPKSVDLVASAPARLAEASVNGQDERRVRTLLGRPQRIQNAVRASLPATPPSRLTFVADVPRGGRLVLAAGIPGRHHGKPAVEFVVNVRQRGRQRTVLSRLVDPANQTADRRWIPLEADLSAYEGRGVELLLETRGFDRTNEADRAFWGTPAITTEADERAPLVVVYLVDTLRADHLGLYGYGRATSRELERFARDAVVFDQAIASASWTKPSVASLFTSLLPSVHRCVQFYTPLDPSFVTLAERLQEHGYGTGAVVANRLVLEKDAHFDQGFTSFTAPAEPQRAAQAVDAALAFLEARQGLPTFLYVHTMDPHSPYAPPPPFNRRFGPPPAPGRTAAEPSDYKERLDRERIVGQYDGEIAYGDQEFGRFLGALKARGLYERAMIVFLSDHGEEFLDHGYWVHGHTLFDELVRVPLIVKYPGNQHAGRRVQRQVQLVDVLPSVLKSQDLPVPKPPAIVGRALEESFAPLGDERPAVFETKYREYVAYGARTRTAKYVRQLGPKDQELFFDLERDPRERANRLAEAGGREHALVRIAESALTAAAFSHRLRVEGQDEYDLRIRTSGWIETVEAGQLDSTERAALEEGRQGLTLILKPRWGRPREVGILTRPHGVPLWLEGSRGGRPLRPRDIRMAADGLPATALPFQFPDVEDVFGLFAPPRARGPGIAMWLVPANRGQPPTFDSTARERLRALGYFR